MEKSKKYKFGRFARPYSESSLRAGARVFACPTCKVEGRLSQADIDRGYQCDACARRDEGVGY
jgi:uncharacterized protein (DUF983 family)